MDVSRIKMLCESLPDGVYFDEDLNGPDSYSCRYCESSLQVDYRSKGYGAKAFAKDNLTHYSDCAWVMAQEILKEIDAS